MKTRKKVFVAASVLAADFGRLARDVHAAEKGGADLIHLDVMDGHFVPNISFGPMIVRTVRGLTRLPLDTHLMIEHPESYVEEFGKAGTSNLTIHVEACKDIRRTIAAIKRRGMTAGVSLKPDTPLSALDEALANVDFVLIMSVQPGFGGQKFMPESLARIRRLKAMLGAKGSKVRIEVDGGVDPSNARSIIEAGADTLVAGTSIFGTKDISRSVGVLRRSALAL